MLETILQNPNLVFYLLAAEGLLLCFLQLRTNGLLRKTVKARISKKENVRQLKEEVKKGESKIPVVKFEKPKAAQEPLKKTEPAEKKARKENVDTSEMAVLQEMMTEFFG